MRELEIPKGVYTSTLAVFSDTHGRVVDETYRYDGPHLSEYDRTKWVAHYEVADPMIEQGLPLVIVQPGLIYGPGDTSSVRTTFISYLERKLPMVPLGTAFCWGHVEDTARGHIQAMERGRAGEAYIIAGERCDLLGALRLAEHITGVSGPRIKIAPGLMKATAGLIASSASFPFPTTTPPNTCARTPKTYSSAIARKRNASWASLCARWRSGWPRRCITRCACSACQYLGATA